MKHPWLAWLAFLITWGALIFALSHAQEFADSPSYHIVIYTRTPTPTPRITPSPSATATPINCIKVTTPPAGSSVTGTINVTTVDTCPGVWFEVLYADGLVVGSFAPGLASWNSTTYANGTHNLSITANTKNPGSVVVGCVSFPVNVSNAH